MEFVLVDVRESEGESWSFSEDIVLLRGIIEINNSASETDVREEIGKAARMKYDILTNNDFEFFGQQWSLRLQTSKVVGWTGISLHETKGSYLLLIGAREF